MTKIGDSHNCAWRGKSKKGGGHFFLADFLQHNSYKKDAVPEGRAS